MLLELFWFSKSLAECCDLFIGQRTEVSVAILTDEEKRTTNNVLSKSTIHSHSVKFALLVATEDDVSVQIDRLEQTASDFLLDGIQAVVHPARQDGSAP